MGDVHAAGNPHIHTDPRNLLPVAAALAERLAETDPANADAYRKRHQDFDQRLRVAITRWEIVGVYLVFASLIIPALAGGERLWRGYAIGAAGYSLGLLASAWLDLPSGAAIVLALAGVALLVRVLRPGERAPAKQSPPL